MKNSKLENFDGYCGKIARAFGRKAGVEVRFEGLGAKTNGKDLIILPANSEEVAKTPEGKQVIDGLLDHEWLHIYFDGVDKRAGRASAMDRAMASQDARYRMLMNIFDDIRIEERAPYEGVRQNLHGMNVDTIGDLRRQASSREENFVNLGKAIILSVRGETVDYFHPGVLARLAALAPVLKDALAAETSDDVHDLSVATMKALKAFEDAAKQEAAEQAAQEKTEQEKVEQEKQDQLGQSPEGTQEGDREEGEPEDGEGEPADGSENTPSDEGEDSEDNGPSDGDAAEDGEESDEDGEGGGVQDPGFDDDDAETDTLDGSGSEGDVDEDADGEGNESGDGEGAEGDADGEGTAGETGEGSDESGVDGDTSGDAGDNDVKSGDGDADGDSDGFDGDFTQGDSLGGEGETNPEPTEPERADDNPEFGEGEQITEDMTGEAAKEDLGDMAQAAQKMNRRHIADPRVLKQDSERTVETASDREVKQFSKKLKGVAGALKNKLVTALLAKRANFTQGDKDRGRLDNRALASVKTGNTRVFNERVMGDSTNVAVTLLVDCSYSMNGARMRMAAEAAQVFGEALNPLNVKFNIWGFQTMDSSYQLWNGYSETPYNRISPYRFLKVKGFSERWATGAKRIPNLPSMCDGCNDDGGALRWAARKLLAQDADRHILIVLSDGRPNDPRAPELALLRNDLNLAIEEITHCGVEVIGLGIEAKHVRDYYPTCDVVTDLAQLPASVMRLLKDSLLKKTKRGGKR
jgi:cobalamin biosynthesis protein CobT